MSQDKTMNVTHPEDLRYLVPKLWGNGKKKKRKGVRPKRRN